MSIVIRRVIDSIDEKCLCDITHNGVPLCCYVHGSAAQLERQLSTELLVEISFDKVVWAEAVANYDDSLAVIGQRGQDDRYHILTGRVINVIEAEYELYDVYLQRGPDSFTVSADEWGLRPQIGDGVRVAVEGLCFYPRGV